MYILRLCSSAFGFLILAFITKQRIDFTFLSAKTLTRAFCFECLNVSFPLILRVLPTKKIHKNCSLSFYAAVFVDLGIEKIKDIMHRPDDEVISPQRRSQVRRSVRQTCVPAKIQFISFSKKRRAVFHGLENLDGM